MGRKDPIRGSLGGRSFDRPFLLNREEIRQAENTGVFCTKPRIEPIECAESIVCISEGAVIYKIYNKTKAAKEHTSRYTTRVHERGRILDFFLKTAKTIEKTHEIP